MKKIRLGIIIIFLSCTGGTAYSQEIAGLTQQELVTTSKALSYLTEQAIAKKQQADAILYLNAFLSIEKLISDNKSIAKMSDYIQAVQDKNKSNKQAATFAINGAKPRLITDLSFSHLPAQGGFTHKELDDLLLLMEEKKISVQDLKNLTSKPSTLKLDARTKFSAPVKEKQ